MNRNAEPTRLPLGEIAERHTHYLFRYPAKFHPPVVSSLLERYVPAGGTMWDNFCGSGTSLIEAGLSGRRSVGSDIDPVAVLVSIAKTRMYDVESLKSETDRLVTVLDSERRSPDEYDRLTFEDIPAEELTRVQHSESLWIPDIPNLLHWFRCYVVIDLARVLRVIENAAFLSAPSRTLALLAFSSIIRNVSNADPVPVSGLEVTSHMRKRDAAGRRIDPFALLGAALRKSVSAVTGYSLKLHQEFEPIVVQADATLSADYVDAPLDAIITSPPYHNAVDYYRRHQLEMYWLKLVRTHTERLLLLPAYIGRPRVPAKNPLVQADWTPGPATEEMFEKMLAEDRQRATDLKHYVLSMGQVFSRMRDRLPDGAPAVMVVGESSWRGTRIPTRDILAEVAEPLFCLGEHLWYPIKNRYMSYTRHNGADIGHEHVLVFR